MAYAKNPSDKWYFYNDSMCKVNIPSLKQSALSGRKPTHLLFLFFQEVNESGVDTNSAYILFYERQNMRQENFIPDVQGQNPDMSDIDDECDNEIKKNCVLQ